MHEAAGVEVEGGHGVDVVHGHGAVVVHQQHPALSPGDRAQTRACLTLPSHIVTSSRLELQTNLRKSFHNHIEDPYIHLLTFFQPGKGPSSGLLRDCENFAEGSLRALVTLQVCSPESRHLCMRWAWPMTSLAAVYRRAGTSRATG